jgi:hypothetical protein
MDFEYNGYDMIEDHIKKLDDLISESPKKYSDEFMKNTLLQSIKRSKVHDEFRMLVVFFLPDDLTYAKLKKKIVNIAIHIEEKKKIGEINKRLVKLEKCCYSMNTLKRKRLDAYHSKNEAGSYSECKTCGKHHPGKCNKLVTCYRCGMKGHYAGDCRVKAYNFENWRFRSKHESNEC